MRGEVDGDVCGDDEVRKGNYRMKKDDWVILVVLLIVSVAAPFVVSEAFKLGAHHPLITTLISPDATIGYMGTAISGLASVGVAMTALRISNKANKLNEQVLEQNEKICTDTSEKAVQPHMSLCIIPACQYVSGFPFAAFDSRKPESEGDGAVHYFEYSPYECSVIIHNDDINIYWGVHELIKQFKSTLFETKKEGNITCVTVPYKQDVYAHIEISNIGCGPAIATQIRIQRTDNPDAEKSIIPHDFRANVDKAHIHLYFSKETSKDFEYEVVVTYQNLHGKKYQQIYPISKTGIIVSAERVTLSDIEQ